jgi:hypothetical protein
MGQSEEWDMYDNEHSTWSKWINEKYQEFRKGKVGNEASVTAFGRQFGAPHQIAFTWLRPGSTPPRKEEYRNRILQVYGDDPEVYNALGTKPPLLTGPDGVILSEEEIRALELFRAAPEQYQEQVLELLEFYVTRAGFRRADDPSGNGRG